MKKILLTTLLVSSVCMADSFAELGLGYSKGDSSDSFLTGFASIRVIGNIDARLEYTKNISENSQFSKEDIKRYGVFATYTLPLAYDFSITPKVGLVKTDGSFTLNNTFKTLSDSSTDFTYGLEVNYDFNPQMSGFIGYTDYGMGIKNSGFDTSKLDTANYTVGIKIYL